MSGAYPLFSTISLLSIFCLLWELGVTGGELLFRKALCFATPSPRLPCRAAAGGNRRAKPARRTAAAGLPARARGVVPRRRPLQVGKARPPALRPSRRSPAALCFVSRFSFSGWVEWRGLELGRPWLRRRRAGA